MEYFIIAVVVIGIYFLVWVGKVGQIHVDQSLLNDNAEDDIQRPNNDALNKPLLCKACGEINDVGDITADNHIHCKCGAIFKVSSQKTAKATSTIQNLAIEKPSSLRWLPVAFYIIASLGFLGWIIIALNLGSWEAFGYGIGSTIACLASGRVIELLQNIDDKLSRKLASD